MNLKDLELNNPVHIKLSQSGNGEFPDSYKLTEKGVELLIEFGKQCFEAGYYAGNYKCRMSKGSAIMNAIISEDFEKYLKSLENA